MDLETTCWGCGLRLLLPISSAVFKCGWCGAISNHNHHRRQESACFSRWRSLRDRCFVSIVLLFMFFIICSGFWAIYPVIFYISFFCGVFHSMVTALLSLCTIIFFCLAAFRSPGAPASILWGSHLVVGKGGLENYTFCVYCEKPKAPRAHHCRTCKMCVLDMDHHCPFIGNCVGAANHRHFVAFLTSVIVSCTYINLMAIYAGLRLWPPLEASEVIKQIFIALLSSALLLSARGLLLLYLFIASTSVAFGISVLLWQQLYFIYKGKTYINNLSSRDDVDHEGGCQNLVRFFSCPHLISRFFVRSNNVKSREMTVSKLL
ncbi:putative S-acyltransferase [Acorus gramineus]|uniref:S-acyltransferase n=1 Tax=Acorus gramineus TaxID=55184 RepID=A0AAV9AD27_ACOGR|nr:putative S-acyltransferase [Acorus gramineus]